MKERKYFVSYFIWFNDTNFETHDAYITIPQLTENPMTQLELEAVKREIYFKKACNEKNTTFVFITPLND